MKALGIVVLVILVAMAATLITRGLDWYWSGLIDNYCTSHSYQQAEFLGKGEWRCCTRVPGNDSVGYGKVCSLTFTFKDVRGEE